MRELHGITNYVDIANPIFLKHQLMLFDRFHVLFTGSRQRELDQDVKPRMEKALVQYLEKRGVVRIVSMSAVNNLFLARLEMHRGSDLEELLATRDDFYLRTVATAISEQDLETVALCRKPLPTKFSAPSLEKQVSLETTIRVAVNALPMPSELNAVDDILNFKVDLRDKRWTFRRFLRDLATKQQTEGEIKDEIEYLTRQYERLMEIHGLKATRGSFEVYILPVIEVAEDLAKMNWTKIAKSALEVSKMNIELMREELTAPGRECAYVFEARKRFSNDGG